MSWSEVKSGVRSLTCSLMSQEALEGQGPKWMHAGHCHRREPCKGCVHWCVTVKRVVHPVLMAVTTKGWGRSREVGMKPKIC